MKALVVDADTVSGRLAALLLKRLGFQSLEIMEASAPHQVAVYDLVLIAADREVSDVAWLHRAYPSARLIVVISERCDTLRDACLRAGADAVLSKPLALQALSDALCDHQDDFNVATWADLRQLFGADGVLRLIGTLVDDLPIQRRSMVAALQGGDLQGLKKISHILRGISAQLGASALAEQWSQAESAAARGDGATAGRLATELMQRHAALVARIRNEADKA